MTRGGRQRGACGPRYVLPAAWELAIAGWVGWLELSGMSRMTVQLRRDIVRAIARQSGSQQPADVTFPELVRLCTATAWSNEHRRAVRTALVAFFDYCVRCNLAADNPASQLPRVRASKGRPRPATDEIWDQLLASAPPRELMMIRLAGEAGMRRAEVARCQRDDLLIGPQGASLIVHGKGGKQRVIPVSESLAEAIRTYRERGYLFPGETDGHLSPRYVGELVSALMPPGFTMHTLRHLYGTRVYRASRNLRAVQRLLGHESVATTERYVACDDDEVRAAMMAAAFS